MDFKRIVFMQLLFVALVAQAQKPLPVIDMHLHASSADENGPPPLGLCIPMVRYMPSFESSQQWTAAFLAGLKSPPCSDPIWSPLTDEALKIATIEVLQRRNIIGVLSGPPERVLDWFESAPDHFIPSVQFQIGRDEYTVESLRALLEQGPFTVLGEVSNQYVGVAPDDERMAPYWALAESLGVPVAIHMGEGPPGAAVLIPTYRASLSSPLLLEEVLNRHPDLRVSIMHYGSPLIDDTIAILAAYPQVYVDLGGIQWFYPKTYFYGQLRRLIDAGFGKRVMFGSDQLSWPGVIEPAIAIINSAPFLSEQEKRDILYNNAARFLKLSPEQIARHHGQLQ